MYKSGKFPKQRISRDLYSFNDHLFVYNAYTCNTYSCMTSLITSRLLLLFSIEYNYVFVIPAIPSRATIFKKN